MPSFPLIAVVLTAVISCSTEQARFEPFTAPYCTRVFDQGSNGLGSPLDSIGYATVENGLIVRIDYDFGADGTLDGVTSREFNSDGRLIRREVDDGDDATYNEIETWTYDADDRLVAFESFVDIDDPLKLQAYYFYDDRGHRVRAEIQYNIGAAPSSIHEYVTDDDGHITYTDISDGEGNPLRYRETRWRGDDELGSSTYSSVDDSLLSSDVKAYQAGGYLALWQRNADGDEDYDEIYRYTWDELGRLTSVSGETADSLDQWTQTYDCAHADEAVP